MGVAIYLGNTEPQMPTAPYPWGLVGLTVLVSIAGHVLERRGQAALGSILAHGGGIAFALLPLVHIYRLWAATS